MTAPFALDYVTVVLADHILAAFGDWVAEQGNKTLKVRANNFDRSATGTSPTNANRLQGDNLFACDLAWVRLPVETAAGRSCSEC